MTNNIFLHGLKLNTKIGLPDWERAVSQQLIIDVDIQLKGNQIFNSNDISKTIDYALIESEIKEAASRHGHYLLEDKKIHNCFSQRRQGRLFLQQINN